MTYTVRKLNHRPWPVIVRVNVCLDGGEVVPQESKIVGHFLPITEKERVVLLKDLRAKFDPPPATEGLGLDTDTQGDAALHVALHAALASNAAEDPVETGRMRGLAMNAWYFERRVCGWSGVQDEVGTPVPYSADLLRDLITGEDGGAWSDGLIAADQQLRLGTAPEKNSETSPASGLASEVASPTLSI
jgi:hypothetical protein